jgi:hypothetical protein
MTLRSGINVTYYRDFVLDEQVLRGIKAAIEQAARGLAFPTEVVYHVHLKDDIYYETNRIEDVLADPNQDTKKIDFLYVELRRADRLTRVYGNDGDGWLVSEWVVWLAFDILRPNMWTPYRDRISLRIDSEDKVWVSNLSEEIDRLILDLPKPRRVSTVWFLAYWLPTFICSWALYTRRFNPGSRFDMIFTAVFALFSLAAGLVGVFFMDDVRPRIFRAFFGPQSIFRWGEQEKQHKFFEQMVVWYSWALALGVFFLTVMGIVYQVY